VLARVVVPILIAIVSMLAAVTFWRAAVASMEASSLEEEATRHLVQQDQREAELRGWVDYDWRLFLRYQEHIKNWRLLDRQAADVPDRPALAARLSVHAQAELSTARALRLYFFGATPGFGNADGNVEYDRSYVAQSLIRNDSELREFRSESTFERASDAHDKTVHVIGIAAIFITALFFLTVARFTGPRVQRLLVVIGTGLPLLALSLLLYVELAT
jgi:hypothetical protein